MRAPFAVALLSSIGLFTPLWNAAQAQAPTQPKAQTPDKLQTDLAAYPAEPIVLVRSDNVYRMQADGTGVQERTVVASIQSESALKQVAVLSMPFAANSQRVEWVYARVRHKDGTVTETPIDNAIEVAAQVTREAPFYSDLKEMQLPMRNLRIGDQLEWQGRIIRTKAEAPNQFWERGTFFHDGVVLSETVTLDVPKDQYLKVWSPKFKPVETVEGDRKIYRWATDNRKRTVGPEAEAFAQAEKKRVRTAEEETEAQEGRLPDFEWTTFKSWEEVGAWYRGLEGDRMQPDAEIKAKVAQLTADKTTELAKEQAVYDYVSLQIHYIGVSFGIGRYQPHGAVDVLANQYGDCKDKHTLLAAMLGALGLHPDAVLIGAGIRFNEAVPSPAAFNHLITRVNVDGKPTFLDSTAETAPFGLLMYMIRDQPALVVPESGIATVVKTAANPPFQATVTMNAVGSIDAEGTSNSKIELTMHGDEEVIVRSAVRQLSPAQYEQFSQQVCASIGYAGTASHLQMSRVDDTSVPFQLSFDYKREKSGDWPNHRIVPQLYPVTLPRPDEKDPPVSAIGLGVPRVEISTASMTLPKGWTAELPLPVHAKSDWATYDLTYRFDKGIIHSERRVQVLKERVPVADWKTYAAFASKADVGNESFIQLLRQPGETDAVSVSGGTPEMKNSPEAAKLVQQAYDAIRLRDFKSAISLLKQAGDINPGQPSLAAGYGNLYLAQGNRREAIKEYQLEISQHPNELRLYPVMASLQYSEGQFEDAESNAKFALESTSGDQHERMELIVGKSQLRDGHKEDAHATLLTLMKKTEDAGMMNDSAYELADAGMELPLAAQTARTALTKREEESRNWELYDDLTQLKSRTAYLQATWDTVGWILFREGKTQEAETYIRASWRGRQSAEVGKHLAEILLARGDKDAALATYRMAIAASSPGDLQKELQAAAEKLHSSGAHESKVDAPDALRALRTMPLGPGENGVAEYKLLINAQGLVRAEPAGDKTVPGAGERIKRAKFSELFPTGSSAQLVLDVFLNCHQGTCELIGIK